MIDQGYGREKHEKEETDRQGKVVLATGTPKKGGGGIL